MQQLLYIDSAVFLQNQRCSHGHRFYLWGYEPRRGLEEPETNKPPVLRVAPI